MREELLRLWPRLLVARLTRDRRARKRVRAGLRLAVRAGA